MPNYSSHSGQNLCKELELDWRCPFWKSSLTVLACKFHSDTLKLIYSQYIFDYILSFRLPIWNGFLLNIMIFSSLVWWALGCIDPDICFLLVLSWKLKTVIVNGIKVWETWWHQLVRSLWLLTWPNRNFLHLVQL